MRALLTAVLLGTTTLLAGGSLGAAEGGGGGYVQGAYPSSPMPLAAGQAWAGRYVCPQGPTALVVRITAVAGLQVHGVFEFNHAPTGAMGQFQLHGAYDPGTRSLAFTPGAWILRPNGYETVGMTGQISPDGMSYTGQILHPVCRTFSVRRVQ